MKRVILYLVLPIVMVLATACEQAPPQRKQVENECSTYPYEWTAPTATSRGYKVFDFTYDVWRNTFAYWIGDTCVSSAILASKAMKLSQESLDSTGYKLCDGLKMYFALDEVPAKLNVTPRLILVPYVLETLVNDSDTLLYLNDSLMGDMPYWELMKGDSGFYLEPLTVKTATEKILHWKGYVGSLYDEGIGAVYSYAFDTMEIKVAMHNIGNREEGLTVQFGMHSVDPSDAAYYFPDAKPGNVHEAVKGYMVHNIIISRLDRSPDDPYFDFSSPCPRYCGCNDPWNAEVR